MGNLSCVPCGRKPAGIFVNPQGGEAAEPQAHTQGLSSLRYVTFVDWLLTGCCIHAIKVLGNQAYILTITKGS